MVTGYNTFNAQPRELKQTKVNATIVVKDTLPFEIRKQSINYISVVIPNKVLKRKIFLGAVYLNPQAD